MIKIKTLNEKLTFDTKQEVIEYFGGGIAEEGQDYFDNNNYFIEIEGGKITNVEEWEWWKENFSQIIHDAIENLELLVGTEFTLLEMDNEVQSILYEVDESGKSSIFEGGTEDYIERGEFSYTIWKNEDKEETVDVNVWFKVIEQNEDNFEIIVEVTDIEEL